MEKNAVKPCELLCLYATEASLKSDNKVSACRKLDWQAIN